jgi:hypothetical protein
VERDRNAAEHMLAERWCRDRAEPLLVDGGIGGSEAANSPCAVGVIKSHRTLYADGAALRIVLGLEPGARSGAFLVTSRKQRAPVASWYLRLRDSRGHEPMWGLVRVEIAEPRGADAALLRERADEVSRWVLAEALPLAMPDSRWDTMVYGVRDCEEFLRAVT